jgi:Anti-sigma-K factor rskA
VNDRIDSLLDAAAEAIVFAHEPDAAPLPPTAGDLPAPELTALERTAALAAAALALEGGRDDVPAKLRQSLAAAGLGYCADQRRRFAAHPPGFTTALPRRHTLGLVTAFTLGAAAAGLSLWLGILQPQTATMQQQAVSLRDLRAQVLASEQNAVRIDWKPGPSPLTGQVAGDVVWSPSRQDGWLTFRGLPQLGPDQAYQLWIVDRRREGAPVDGGLFTIQDPTAETLVPIHAKLPIGSPVAFVITVEDKAGVVVSKQEHVVAIAGL